MSVITYNGITLPYPYITNFKQEALYDPQSNTDWYCIKYDISVETFMSKEYLMLLAPSLVPGTPPDNAAIIMKAVRKSLMTPRKLLQVTFNDINLLPGDFTEGQSGIDSLNGPQPQSFDYVQLTNTLFLVIYRIIAHYWENPTVTPATASKVSYDNTANTVLYNRWSETAEYDKNQFCTRTREGKLLIRSDNKNGLIADQVRSQMAVVSVPDGFLRDSSSYTVDPNGLGLSYKIVDREVFKKPPPPAFEADGYYMETVTEPGGAKRIGEVSVVLKGSKTTSQEELINSAVRVAATKLNIRGYQLARVHLAPLNRFFILYYGGCKIGLYENSVSVVLRGMIAQENADRRNRIASFLFMDTFTPQSDGIQYTPGYLDRGTSNFLLQAAAYYDPTLSTTRLAASANAEQSDITTRGDSRTNFNTGRQPGQAGALGE